MRILIINPNSSDAITNSIYNEAIKYQNDNLIIDVEKAESGPKIIMTYYDELLAAAFVVNKFQEVGEKYDAGIVGCFSDPGLAAAKEIMNMPVVGICESTIYTACLCGNRFSIVAAGGSEEISVFHEIVRKYGVESRLASVRYLSIGTEEIGHKERELIKENINKCVYEDGANVIILGCAAFAGLGDVLTAEMKLPVLDGIKESISFAKMLASNSKKLK